jgi:hypothetical protein
MSGVAVGHRDHQISHHPTSSCADFLKKMCTTMTPAAWRTPKVSSEGAVGDGDQYTVRNVARNTDKGAGHFRRLLSLHSAYRTLAISQVSIK